MTQDIIKFIDDLRKLPSETEWVEFKLNHQAPEKIGEYISALANAASLHQRPEAFLVFGIENKTHAVKGTTFQPRTEKGKGNEDLEPWLQRNLKPNADFQIQELKHPDGRLVIFFIKPASNGPIKIFDKAWIRIGSSKKDLNAFPEKEAIIWERRISFEERIAKENASEDEILNLLNHDQYFRLTGATRPRDTQGIIEKFLQEDFLLKRKGRLHITNLGAILLAQDITQFPKLKNKAIRIVTYKGINHLDAIKDTTGTRGYAVGFGNIIAYIESQVPEPEVIKEALRVTKSTYPTNTIREFVANALVHQDFSVPGSSPFIEIFSDRIEISNPGRPLIDPDRFIDNEPRSRNEKLTDTLRRMKICEKRGSGVDRAIREIELSQLPAPKIENKNDGVRVSLYSHKELNQLTKEEKCRACYLHSCIKHVVDQEPMKNASLCKRLNIEEKNQSIASRIIKETLEKGLIKPFDLENKSSRYAQYLPFWA
jgi:ATP-dependent DNA helicase RecG